MRSTLRLAVTVGVVAGLVSACGVPDYSFGGTGGAGGADASTGGSGGTGASNGEAGPDAGCQSDQDCADPTPRCNTSTGQCVRCLPSADTCPAGQYCTSATYTCQKGCKSDTECNAFDGGGALSCDPKTHRCDGCTKDDDCPLGNICNKTTTQCVPGCTQQHGCDGSLSCCSGKCVDTAFGDVDNCGSCGHVCQFDPTNSTPSCSSGTCKLTCTQLGTANCNGNLADGCEADISTDSKNCGTCNHICTGNQICQNKACVSADAG